MGTTGANPRKKGEYSLLSEITSEEEWSKLGSREGLFIIDVYSEWSGPCLAMTNFLKKIKLEINDDLLHYASARIDSIPSLSQFQGLCRPLWLVLSFGRVVAVVHGANAPLLGRVIETEIENEKLVIAGEKERETISLDDVLSEFVTIEEISLTNENEDVDSPLEEDPPPPRSIIDDFSLLLLPQISEVLLSHLNEFLESLNIVTSRHLVVKTAEDTDGLIQGVISSNSDEEREDNESYNLLLVSKNSPGEEQLQKELMTYMQDPKCTLSSQDFGITLVERNDFYRLLEHFFLEKDPITELVIQILEPECEKDLLDKAEGNDDFSIIKRCKSLKAESLSSETPGLQNPEKLQSNIEMTMVLLRVKNFSAEDFESGAFIREGDLSNELLVQLFGGDEDFEELKNNCGLSPSTTKATIKERAPSKPLAFLSSLLIESS